MDVFDPREFLVFRFYRNDVAADGSFKSHRVSLPDQSMNRTALRGKPWFVLLPDPDMSRERRKRRLCMGIVVVKAKSLPQDIEYNGVTYDFWPKHDPLPRNYHHCEIRLDENGTRLEATEFDARRPRLSYVKKRYREILAEHVRVLLHAEIDDKSVNPRK